eukprot:TRINITY_DN4547_c0_g2_i1.p1 TRINITY_DN4547_c0_g2~~TRINITY_DN4547_c0_g2_i1.p1  ORF type:complete len:592 (-),score=115.77 TRINITY_DN4547_c0_g2_i1:161-1936(-)
MASKERERALNEVFEPVSDVVKMLANEPAIGLFYVQHHVQRGIPNAMALTGQLKEGSTLAEYAVDDVQAARAGVRTIKEVGPPLVERMLQSLENSAGSLPATRKGSRTPYLPAAGTSYYYRKSPSFSFYSNDASRSSSPKGAAGPSTAAPSVFRSPTSDATPPIRSRNSAEPAVASRKEPQKEAAAVSGNASTTFHSPATSAGRQEEDNGYPVEAPVRVVGGPTAVPVDLEQGRLDQGTIISAVGVNSVLDGQQTPLSSVGRGPQDAGTAAYSRGLFSGMYEAATAAAAATSLNQWPSLRVPQSLSSPWFATTSSPSAPPLAAPPPSSPATSSSSSALSSSSVPSLVSATPSASAAPSSATFASPLGATNSRAADSDVLSRRESPTQAERLIEGHGQGHGKDLERTGKGANQYFGAPKARTTVMDDVVSTTSNVRGELISDSAADHTTEGARQQPPAAPDAGSHLPSQNAQHGRSEAIDGNRAEPFANGEMAGASLEAAEGGSAGDIFPEAIRHVKGNGEQRTEEGKSTQLRDRQEEVQSVGNSIGGPVDEEAEVRRIDAIRAAEEFEGVKQSQLERYSSWLEEDGEGSLR